MRKYLYLITEHEDDAYVGTVQMTDIRLDHPTKNEAGPYTVFNEETGDFNTVGEKVGVGYYDFDADELDDNDAVADVLQSKLREIDEKWLRKAGVEIDA